MSSSGKKYELVNLESGKKTVLEARSGTVGPDCLNIGGLNKDHGVFTFDPGFMATAAAKARSPTSTATTACCCIAATRSSSSPRRVELPRSRVPAAQRRAAGRAASSSSSTSRSATTR